MPIVLKSGSLNLLEPSKPAQACNGIALPFILNFFIYYCNDLRIFKRCLQTCKFVHNVTQQIRKLKIANRSSRGRVGGNGVKEKEKDEYPAIKRLPTERQSVVSLFVAVLLGRTCEEKVIPLSVLSFDCFRFYNRKMFSKLDFTYSIHWQPFLFSLIKYNSQG